MIYDLLYYFVIYSVLGWCAEVIFHTVVYGEFANRGFLNGPICPIYGFGMAVIIVCLTPLNEYSWILLFAGSFVITSALEWITGFVLDKAFRQRWWDYSTQPFNIGGYICLKFSIIWGFAGVFIMRIVHPPIASFVSWIPHTAGVIILCVILAIYIADSVVTIVGMCKLNTRLRHLEEIAKQMHELSDNVGERLSDGVSGIMENVKELQEKPEAKEAAAKAKQEYGELKAKYEDLIKRKNFIHSRLIKAFPKAESPKYSQGFAKLKESVGRRRRK